jgi:hypothetical protein
VAFIKLEGVAKDALSDNHVVTFSVGKSLISCILSVEGHISQPSEPDTSPYIVDIAISIPS